MIIINLEEKSQLWDYNCILSKVNCNKLPQEHFLIEAHQKVNVIISRKKGYCIISSKSFVNRSQGVIYYDQGKSVLPCILNEKCSNCFYVDLLYKCNTVHSHPGSSMLNQISGTLVSLLSSPEHAMGS